MLARQDLVDHMELMQNDLQCLLDEYDDFVITAACQIIVDHMHVLLDKLNEGD